MRESWVASQTYGRTSRKPDGMEQSSRFSRSDWAGPFHLIRRCRLTCLQVGALYQSYFPLDRSRGNCLPELPTLAASRCLQMVTLTASLELVRCRQQQ
jgi:hypothetical protein